MDLVVVCSALTLLIAGLASIAATRNMVKVIMGLQAMTLASLLLLSLAFRTGGASADDMFLLIASATATTEALGIAIALLVWERFRRINPQEVSDLRW